MRIPKKHSTKAKESYSISGWHLGGPISSYGGALQSVTEDAQISLFIGRSTPERAIRCIVSMYTLEKWKYYKLYEWPFGLVKRWEVNGNIYIIVLTDGTREECRHQTYLDTFSGGFSRRVVVQFLGAVETPKSHPDKCIISQVVLILHGLLLRLVKPLWWFYHIQWNFPVLVQLDFNRTQNNLQDSAQMNKVRG